MSLAAHVERRAAIINQAKRAHEVKTLIIDVERLPGWATVQIGDITINGPFWSLNDFKRRGILRRRINPDEVTEWPRTITASWRWFGNTKIHFAAEWQQGGAQAFAEKVRDKMDKADIVSGHYVNGADRKWLNSLFRDHGLRFPSPYRVIDTLAVARRELGDESMQLGALCTRYGIPTKQGKYDAHVARRACNGSRKDQAEIREYNMADVEASTGLLAVMLPIVRSMPHAAPIKGIDNNLCPRCGSADITRHGTYSPQVHVYPRYLCNTCTGWYTVRHTQLRGPSVKTL